MSPVEFLTNRAKLPLLELADRQAAPAVGRADDGGVHELQHWPLSERVRDDLRAPALLKEEPLEQIRGPDHLAMPQRETQMGDAGVEVVGEALDHRGQLAAVGLHEVVAQQPGQRGRGRLIARPGPDRDLGPLTLRALLRRLRSRWTRQR